MDANIEDAYYKCIDKLGGDIERDEPYLIKCVTFLHRQAHGRADRDRITADFTMDRGIEKYENELIIISKLSKSELATLIASSIDLSPLVKELEEKCERVKKGIVYDEVHAKHVTEQIHKAREMLIELSKVIRDK